MHLFGFRSFQRITILGGHLNLDRQVTFERKDGSKSKITWETSSGKAYDKVEGVISIFGRWNLGGSEFKNGSDEQITLVFSKDGKFDYWISNKAHLRAIIFMGG